MAGQEVVNDKLLVQSPCRWPFDRSCEYHPPANPGVRGADLFQTGPD